MNKAEVEGRTDKGRDEEPVRLRDADDGPGRNFDARRRRIAGNASRTLAMFLQQRSGTRGDTSHFRYSGTEVTSTG